MTELVFDIETVPDETMPESLQPEPALGNLKDPVKIEAKIKEWKEGELIKKMSVSPFMNQIVSIQAYSVEDFEFIDFSDCKTEKEMIKHIFKLIDEASCIIGHNIIGFDLPTLQMRAMLHGVSLPLQFRHIKKYSNRPFYDTMQVLAGWDSSKWKGLQWWCERLGIEGKTGHGSSVYEWWKEGKQEEIDSYCKDDVWANAQLYERIKNHYL